MPSAADIIRHHEPLPGDSQWVHGPPPPRAVELVEYDPRWPVRYAALAAQLRAALGEVIVELGHVGSTSVPGLAAKDIIDIDLTVADPRDEDRYVPALAALGYVLVVREPWWHEHRCLHLPVTESGAAANLHVFPPDCAETIRHAMFRDWLIAHPEDLRLYEDAKRAAIPGGGHVMDYNRRKQEVIRAIYDRAFRAAGLL